MTPSSAPPLVLASSSPRRQALLESLGHPFSVCTPDVDESPLEGEGAESFAIRVARDKAAAVVALLLLKKKDPSTLVLAADTVVTLDGHLLGKPENDEDALRMLALLSGATHQVITGVCLRRAVLSDREHPEAFAISTDVVFREVAVQERARYVASGEPRDKAGAYAIQGGAAHMVRAVHGSYSNVVGLPLAEVAERLAARYGPPQHDLAN